MPVFLMSLGCGGDCDADVNDNGVCDNAEVDGCMDELACNFHPGPLWTAATVSTTATTMAYDDIDDCIGVIDVCGVCNGAGPVYDCGVPTSPKEIVIVGNTEDALGECGGDCEVDADADGM